LPRTPAGTPCRCATRARPRRAASASSSPAPLQTCSCACAAGLSPAEHRAGEAPRSRRTPAASQDPSPSHNRSAARPPGVPPPTSQLQPVASLSASRSSCTSTSRGRYTAHIELTTEERASLSAYPATHPRLRSNPRQPIRYRRHDTSAVFLDVPLGDVPCRDQRARAVANRSPKESFGLEDTV